MTTKKRLINWINNFVTTFNPEFGGVPCPYASKSMRENRIQINWVKNLNILDNKLKKISCIDENHDVIIHYIKVEKHSLNDVYEFTEKYNNYYRENNIDLFILFDHPDRSEYIKGVHMNFEDDTILILLQKKSHLDKAREKLHKEGFYDDWDEKSYRRVVLGEKV